MRNIIFIPLLFTILITAHVTGCRRYVGTSDSGQQERLSVSGQQKMKKTYEIIRRDGHYIEYANGVVYDEDTGLEWYAGPDKDITFDAAKTWVENLTVAGGKWRMPNRYELSTLYKKGAGTINMTPLLETTGMWVWASEIKDSSAWTFNFEYGYGHWDFRSNDNYFRAFAVRYP